MAACASIEPGFTNNSSDARARSTIGAMTVAVRGEADCGDDIGGNDKKNNVFAWGSKSSAFDA